MEIKKVLSRTRTWYNDEYEEHFTEKEFLSFTDFPLKYEWTAYITEETLKFDTYMEVAERVEKISERDDFNKEKYTIFVETVIIP